MRSPWLSGGAGSLRALPRIDWRSTSGPLRRTSRQPATTASGSSRSAPSGPGGTMSISACCAVLIMVVLIMTEAALVLALDSECLDAAGAQVSDLEQVVVGLGPGPFTGLRVGVVTAQVLGQVLGLEL